MEICNCLIEDIFKRANGDWLEQEVKNPSTGNIVKVKSLPPEQQEKYRPKKVNKEEIEEKKKKLPSPKTREEKQFQFIVPELWKVHNDKPEQFSHKVKDKMKNLGLSFTKDKRWLEPLLEDITDTKWQTNRNDFAYASNDKIKKIAGDIIDIAKK